MYQTQLECMIECDPVLRQGVTGVYAADRLPTRAFNRPYGFIANTQSHALRGEHWCAFYDDGRGHVVFFDSYGRPPRDNSVLFQRWLNAKAKTVGVNRTQLQHHETSVCGLYCILFLRTVLTGHTLEQFVNIFDPDDTGANDAYVTRLVSRAYSECQTGEHAQICTSLCKPYVF